MVAELYSCQTCSDTKKVIIREPDGSVLRSECPECVAKKYTNKLFLDSGIPPVLLQSSLESKDPQFASFLSQFSRKSLPLKTYIFTSLIPDTTLRHAAILVKTAIDNKMTSRLISLSSLFSKLGESDLPWPTTLCRISDDTDVFVLHLCRELRGSVSKETDLFYSLYRRRRMGAKPFFIFSELDFSGILDVWGEQMALFFRQKTSDLEFVELKE